MAGDFVSFTRDLTRWLGGQPPRYTGLFPAKTYRRLYRMAKAGPGGKALYEEDDILQELFDGDPDMREPVRDLVAHLNRDTSTQKAAAPRAAARPAPTPTPRATSESHTGSEPRTRAEARRARMAARQARMAGGDSQETRAAGGVPPVPAPPAPQPSTSTPPVPAPPVPAPPAPAAASPTPPVPGPPASGSLASGSAASGSATHEPATPAQPARVPQPRFPRFDYSQDGVEAWGDVSVHSVPGPSGQDILSYSWAEVEGEPLYRIVTSDLEEPINPDEYETIGVSEETFFDDANPPTSPFRFVTVWAYPRNPHNPNVLHQGRLIARSLFVHPLKNWQIRSVDGTAVSEWETIEAVPGASVNVEIARLPQGEQPGRFMRAMAWLEHAFPDNGTGYRTGFQDTEVEEGNDYTYVAAVRVRIGDVDRYSTPSRERYSAEPGAISRVTDLQVTHDEAQENWELEWTKPSSGDVQIYRTFKKPDAGAVDRAELPTSSLAEAGLDEESRLRSMPRPLLGASGRPIGSKWRMDTVKWPEGEEWDSAYLTPVTVLGERCVIGEPVAQKRARRVEGAKIVQRMTWQLVTFAWPGNAHSVSLHRTGKGEALTAESPVEASIEREEYERSGGFILKDPLPSEGADLYLSSVSYFQGKPIRSIPTLVEADPLWGHSYAFEWPAMSRTFLSRVRSHNVVTVHVQAMLGRCPQELLPKLRLVYNPDRLPLLASDGVAVRLHAQKPGSEPTESSFEMIAPSSGSTVVYFDAKDAELGSERKGGYFRLMVIPEESGEDGVSYSSYALNDPPISELRNG